MNKTKAIAKHRFTASDSGVRMVLDNHQLAVLHNNVRAAYKRIKTNGVTEYKKANTLRKNHMELLLIEMCYRVMVKLGQQLAKQLHETTVTLPMAEICALQELYELDYLKNEDWQTTRQLFFEIHPLLTD